MTGSLPWGWLNSTAPVMPGTEHQHDDVTLRPDERLRLGSIVAGWDEDDTPCTARTGCGVAAAWYWECTQCGHMEYACHQHKIKSDTDLAFARRIGRRIGCSKCRTVLAESPWRPL